jgi:hypothetical protein
MASLETMFSKTSDEEWSRFGDLLVLSSVGVPAWMVDTAEPGTRMRVGEKSPSFAGVITRVFTPRPMAR